MPRWLKRVFEQQRRELGCFLLFLGIATAFMADRFYFFLLLNETVGIRQVTEIGLLMSRTTAAGMSFIYPLLLLSMSRNLLTVLRQKYINQFIPFDRSVDFHKTAAKIGGFMALVHTIGHVINFRNIALQAGLTQNFYTFTHFTHFYTFLHIFTHFYTLKYLLK